MPELFSTLNAAVMLALLAQTLGAALQLGGRRRVDIALLVASLAIPVTIGAAHAWLGRTIFGLEIVSALFLLAHPFLLVRALDAVRPVPRGWMLGAMGLWLASSLLFLYLRRDGLILSAPSVAVIAAMMLVPEAYAFGQLVLGARRSQGARRKQLRLVSVGIGLLISLLAAVATLRLLGVQEELLTLAVRVGGSLMVLSFYFAFAPPRWLRRVWEDAALRDFIERTSTEPDPTRLAALKGRLLAETACRLVGADACAVVVDLPGGLQTAYTYPPQASELTPLAKAIPPSRPPFARVALPKPLESVEASELLVIVTPKANGTSAAVLLPVARVPLFAEETANAVRMLARRVAAAWLHVWLLEEQQRLKAENQRREQEAWEARVRAAQEADRLKGQFVAHMSHEVRTPLNAVLGLSALLQGTRLDEQQRDYLRKIEVSGNHLLALLSDILDYSRMEAGRLQVRRQPMRLEACIREALAIVSKDANAKGLRLDAELDPKLPKGILGDAPRLRQVLVNLLGNAVKFTDTGSVVLRVRVDGGAGAELKLTFEVEDTGPGIPEASRSQLFRSFEQADSSATRRHGGTGLGLAICKQIVESWGGAIGFASREGAGTTFTFTLPTTAAEPPEPSADESPAEDLQGRRAAALVRDPALATTLVTYLQPWGMVVQVAEDAAELSRIPADVVLVASAHPEAAVATEQARRDQRPVLALGEGGLPHAAATLELPLAASTLHAALHRLFSTSGAPALALDPGLAARMPLRILVAEDTPMNQEVIVGLLRRLGYDVDLAPDGAKALEAVAAKVYDLVLMDLQMPVVDGLTATREIRRRHGPRPIIVALTAHAGKDQRDAAAAAGCDDYLVKPLGVQPLVRSLERAAKALEVEQSQTAGVTPESAAAAPGRRPSRGRAAAHGRSAKGSQARTVQLADPSRWDDCGGRPDLDLDAAVEALGVAATDPIVGRLTATFRAEAVATVDRLDQALRAHDRATVRSIAHALKSMAATVGGECLATQAARLEQAAEENAPLPADGADLKRSLRRVLDALAARGR